MSDVAYLSAAYAAVVGGIGAFAASMALRRRARAARRPVRPRDKALDQPIRILRYRKKTG